MFNNNTDFNADIFRNIVSLIKPVDLFDDLLTKETLEFGTQIALAAEARVKFDLPSGQIEADFHHSTAIGYPFQIQPFMTSRYGDGSYGVWYGSLEKETTIHETVFHMFQDELGIEGVRGVIYRERAVYSVHAEAILIDLRGQEKEHPDLVANHYELTHAVGARMHREGHPGLLVPSARCEGDNLVALNPVILSRPTLLHHLIYQLDVANKSIRVQDQKGKIIFSLVS